jgi:hypothetical protein
MDEAIINGGADIGFRLLPFVHGLKQEMAKIEVLDLRGVDRVLRIDELKLIP